MIAVNNEREIVVDNEREIAVGCISVLKRRTGVHSSLVASSHNNMLGKRITAGQLIEYEHYLCRQSTMRFDWALQHYT